MTVLIIVATALAVIIPAYYMYMCYVGWESEFGGSRLRRSDEKSESFGNPPHPVPYETEHGMVSYRAAAYDHAELSDYKVDQALLNTSDEHEIKELAERTKSFSPKAYSVKLSSIGKKMRNKFSGSMRSDGRVKTPRSGRSLATSIRTDDEMSTMMSTVMPNSRNVKFSTTDETASLLKSSSDTKKSWGYDSVVFNVFGKSMTKSQQQRAYSVMGQGVGHAEELNMDHQYIPFLDYFWSVVFIGHNGFFLWMTGCMKLKIRDLLHRWGWVKPLPHDPYELVGKLVLEASMAVHYVGKREEGEGDDKKVIGGFFFADFPYIKGDGSFATAEILSIEIDLEKKRMLWAKMDDKTLTPEEATILLWYYTISAQHVKLHALSNWAINMEPKQKKENPFPAQNSLVTTIYNYFGYTAFSTFFSTWQTFGLLSDDWNHQSWIDTVNLGIEDSFFAHPLIRELVPYSEFVHFHVKLRPFFMKEFAKVKGKYFPGCHGEAMFVGTIMHSLDHTRMDWNMEDVLWLDTSHPEYGKMAEMGRIVKVGFVKDLPGLLFHKRYKGANHPFYDKIYKEAAKINLKLADNMDTCIVK